ncbi:hypothetical protein [Fibrobacter sp. UWEL]|uniref:hypothetical protein n=1 Tax=Fibrobacter sp. UWEL TaxID=1896209 RepID=UPI00092484F9|nr:hypothetical protein [Fibrobacter sp. UWEL]SHK55602.1 hypothetical protein SAMN05720468_103106 [Fibrobacter sp. UWEL]
MKYLITSTLLLALGLSACVYEPEQFEESSSAPASGSSSEIGTVRAINSGKQICNPSISQDTANYPGAMLWLNFGGVLNVTPKDSNYTTRQVVQHDRLTVTNQDNEVVWYLMMDSTDCQFQDPEWSTHPNFVVATRGVDSEGSKGCTDLDYGIFAARMSDHKQFWLVDKGLGEFTTPHLWVDPSVTDLDTTASDTTVQGFFGTENVRLVYVDTKSEINFVDFANGGVKKTVKLKKPAEMQKENWTPDSPMISPDGKFIVFNAVKIMGNSTVMKSYIQKLDANATAVEMERSSDMMGEPMQPHWFKYGARLFVTWTEVSENNFFVKGDLSLAETQDGSLGRTVMREISLDANAPADLAMQWVGSVIEIAPVPMTGGRSPDGKFLATGYQNGFMLELP